MPHRPTYVPQSASRVVFSVNPKAGGGSSAELVEQVQIQLQQSGFRCETTTDLATAAERAHALHHAGELRALVAVGGDGTAAELVNRTEPGVPLALLPAGNENLLARYLNVQKSASSVCKTIVQGRLVTLDAARANNRVFLLMIGCGFDGEVVHQVHGRRVGHIRSRDYFKPIWNILRTYAYPPIRAVEFDADDERPAPEACRWFFAFNLPCYGGGLRLAPRANGRDGLLDVCTFSGRSIWQGLGYAAAVYAQVHESWNICRSFRTRRMQLSAEGEVHYQLDGDPGGTLPVEIESLPGRLSLLTPEGRADELEVGRNLDAA